MQEDFGPAVAPDQAAGRAYAVHAVNGQVREHEQDHERLHHAADPAERLAVCDECLPAEDRRLRGRLHRRQAGRGRRRHRQAGRRRQDLRLSPDPGHCGEAQRQRDRRERASSKHRPRLPSRRRPRRARPDPRRSDIEIHRQPVLDRLDPRRDAGGLITPIGCRLPRERVATRLPSRVAGPHPSSRGRIWGGSASLGRRRDTRSVGPVALGAGISVGHDACERTAMPCPRIACTTGDRLRTVQDALGAEIRRHEVFASRRVSTDAKRESEERQ